MPVLYGRRATARQEQPISMDPKHERVEMIGSRTVWRSEGRRRNGPSVQGRIGCRLRQVCRYAACLAFFFGELAYASPAQIETSKIVGLGATPCLQFTNDIRENPSIRRDYLAWAQGFMSGILLGRPSGTDTGLDLNPQSFGLLDQLRFLEEQCARNPAFDFSDAVGALYKRLRKEGAPKYAAGNVGSKRNVFHV